MRFPLFVAAMSAGAFAKSWASQGATTAYAHAGIEHRETVHTFKSEAKRALIFDQHQAFCVREVINLSEEAPFSVSSQSKTTSSTRSRTLQACFRTA